MPRANLAAAIATLLALVAAGCLSPDAPTADIAPASVPALSASLPAFTKFSFSTDVQSPTDPVDAILGRAHEAKRSFDVPAGTGEARVSMDAQPAGQDKATFGDVKLHIADGEGKKVFDGPVMLKAGKLVAFLTAPPAGSYSVVATYRGLWTIGTVVVTTPADYTPGIVVNVSSPEQTQVEHTYYPKEIGAAANTKARITLYDYDPHAGIENLQHNIFIPAIGMKTEGKTTWGEVRTLDFTTPAKPGTYEFYCEFHKNSLKGTLTVT